MYRPPTGGLYAPSARLLNELLEINLSKRGRVCRFCLDSSKTVGPITSGYVNNFPPYLVAFRFTRSSEGRFTLHRHVS